jgi:hypothetical protein
LPAREQNLFGQWRAYTNKILEQANKKASNSWCSETDTEDSTIRQTGHHLAAMNQQRKGLE